MIKTLRVVLILVHHLQQLFEVAFHQYLIMKYYAR